MKIKLVRAHLDPESDTLHRANELALRNRKVERVGAIQKPSPGPLQVDLTAKAAEIQPQDLMR